jgi:Ca2+-binding RTX toxin-like protein
LIVFVVVVVAVYFLNNTMVLHTQLSIYFIETMPERIIKRREYQLNNNHKNNSKNNHRQQYRHNTILSQISVSILFAALVGTTGSTIALATMAGGVSSMLFPSAEATPVYRCEGLIATILGTISGNDVLQGTLGDDVIIGFGGNDQIFGNGGFDRICGGIGDDNIYGGNSQDILNGRGGL